MCVCPFACTCLTISLRSNVGQSIAKYQGLTNFVVFLIIVPCVTVIQWNRNLTSLSTSKPVLSTRNVRQAKSASHICNLKIVLVHVKKKKKVNFNNVDYLIKCPQHYHLKYNQFLKYESDVLHPFFILSLQNPVCILDFQNISVLTSHIASTQ